MQSAEKRNSHSVNFSMPGSPMHRPRGESSSNGSDAQSRVSEMKDSAFTSRAISEASRDVPYYFDNEHMDFKLPNVGDDPLESRGLGAHALYNFRSLDSLTKDASMLILELSSSNDEKGVPGEYKDMTVRELLAAVNKEALEIDSKILGSYANMVSVRRFNRKVEVRRGNMNSDKEHVGPQKRSPSYGKVKSEAEAANILLSGITGYLQNKDVRRIEFKYTPNDEPRVTLRRHCVVFSFDPIRAIITPSKMYICVPDGADTMLSLLQRHIQTSFRGNDFSRGESSLTTNKDTVASVNQSTSIGNGNGQGLTLDSQRYQDEEYDEHLPWEMRCYDAILASALALQLRQYDRNFSGSRELLSEFSNVTLISAASQEQMRLMKNRLNSMVAVLRAYKRLMTSQLDDDADMALMNLSILKDNPFLYTYPLSEDIIRMHELTETLLETYLRDLISVEMKLNTLKLQIQAAEELVSLRLDTSRNQLLIVDVAISTCALGVCLGAYIGSIFGMNLQSGIEETPHVFTVVSVLSAVLSIAVIGFVGWYLQHTRIVPFQMMNFFAKNEVAPKSSMFRHRQTLMSADTLHYGNAGVGSSSSSLSPTRSKDVSVL